MSIARDDTAPRQAPKHLVSRPEFEKEGRTTAGLINLSPEPPDHPPVARARQPFREMRPEPHIPRHSTLPRRLAALRALGPSRLQNPQAR